MNWQCTAPAGSSGTVTSVATGAGLTGGPISTSGTINLAATNLLPTTTCALNQIPKWNGSAWACAADADTNSGGTVTSITAGAGLTGGTILGSGTIAIDPNSATLSGNYLKQGGNAFGATAVLGTTDNQPLELAVNGWRVLRFEPNNNGGNTIGGDRNNTITAGVAGATIAGGGFDFGEQNRVTDNFGTIGGGGSNRAGNDTGTTIDGRFATVAGGQGNVAGGAFASVGGGSSNQASGTGSRVGGGQSNTASGLDAAVGGGNTNSATASYSTVSGGFGSSASGLYALVGGGQNNFATGFGAMALGGYANLASGVTSFAAGYRASTQSAGGVVHNGAFVWADSTNVTFNSSAANEFSARATGGVRFVTAVDGPGNPTRALRINPNAELEFGSTTRQMLNLWGPSAYGVGVQADTLYQRSAGNFAWYQGGTHSDTVFAPGAAGTALMTLTTGSPAGLPVVSGIARAQTFTSTSDRAAKEGFELVDAGKVLAALVKMPLKSWKYRNEDKVRHIGPTAQDFRAAFHVGYDDKTIATVDADGVAMAAIQGLHQLVKEKDTMISGQAARIAALEHELQRIKTVLGLK